MDVQDFELINALALMALVQFITHVEQTSARNSIKRRALKAGYTTKQINDLEERAFDNAVISESAYLKTFFGWSVEGLK